MADPPHPNPQSYNRFQVEYFDPKIKKTMVPRDTPYLRRHIDEAIRFGGLTPGESVLEVGCGMGRYTLLLARRGLQLEGLDLSPVLLDYLSQVDAGAFNIRLHCANVDDPPAELRGRFDVVAGFFVLHHFFDLGRGMHGIRQFLKPGGRVVFLEPNPLCPLYYLQILFTPGMKWQGEKGILRMHPKPLALAMQAAGLGGFAMHRFGFFPPFLANRSWGSRLEAALERIPRVDSFKAFQLVKGQLE